MNLGSRCSEAVMHVSIICTETAHATARPSSVPGSYQRRSIDLGAQVT